VSSPWAWKNPLDRGGAFSEKCGTAAPAIADYGGTMELQVTAHDGSVQDEREWELSDEDLDRSADQRGPGICSTSRPCTCQRCMCR
jgi:hypothetical protein